MKITKLGKSLITSLGAISPKLAQDAGLAALVGELTKKTFKKADVLAGLIAMDAECKEKAETVMDGFEDDEPDAKEKEKKAADAKKAADMARDEEEEEEEEKKKAADAKKAADDRTPAAMDAFKKELRDADEARRAVRSIVGDVIAQDSAEEIYGFALDHMKVDRKDVKELSGLKALYSLASANASKVVPITIAQDSAGALARFPNAARFRQG